MLGRVRLNCAARFNPVQILHMTKTERQNYLRDWHQKNKEERRRKKQIRRKEQPLAERAGLYRWRKNNPEKMRKINRKWAAGRRKRDPSYRLLMALRCRLCSALKGRIKSARTLTLLGCTIPEFWTYLEGRFKSGMTRRNHGSVWQIDHRRPCASFDLSDPAQQKFCFHWTNLQPLFIKENQQKGDKWPQSR